MKARDPGREFFMLPYEVTCCANAYPDSIPANLKHLGNSYDGMLANHTLQNRNKPYDSKSVPVSTDILIGKRRAREALISYEKLQENKIKPDIPIILAALKACNSLKALQIGKKIHANVIDSGEYTNIVVASTLVHMYMKCGSNLHACSVFDQIQHHNVESWNVLIFGYAENGEGKLALHLFCYMQDRGFLPNSQTYVAAVKACARSAAKEKSKKVGGRSVKIECLEIGIAICSQITKVGHDVNIFVGNTLIDMYARCGSLLHSRQVFNRMSRRSVVTWNAMIFGYLESGESELALELYAQMQDEGFTPDALTFIAALKACASSGAKADLQVGGNFVKEECLKMGASIHSQVTNSRHQLDIFVTNSLVDMYVKCGGMMHAQSIFDTMLHRSVVTWNSLIFGYAESTDCELALQLFVRMQSEGVIPDTLTYVAALKACARCATKEEGYQSGENFWKLESLEKGMAIHAQLAKSGHELNTFLENILVDMYAKCGSMLHAHGIFVRMRFYDIVSWNALIYGYGQCGQGDVALQLFLLMQSEGFMPDARTYVAAMKAHSSSAVKEEGNIVDRKVVKVLSFEKALAIHSQLAKTEHELDIFVSNTLMDMYCKCGSLVHAHHVFDRMLRRSVVTWNAIIFGYAESGEGELALNLFARMQDEGFLPDAGTYVAALKACASSALKEVGKQVQDKSVKLQCLEKTIALHSQLAKSRNGANLFVTNTLMDVYAKCGSMFRACHIFESMPQHSVVTWNTMLFGYVENGEGELALKSFLHMQDEGFVPGILTYVAAVKACANYAMKEECKGEGKCVKVESLEMGIAINSQLRKNGHHFDTLLANTLVDMYAKCGSMKHCHQVFEAMLHPSLVTWNAMVFGHAESGEGELALQLFVRMQEEGYPLDHLTYGAAVKACVVCAAKEDGKSIGGEVVKIDSLEIGIAIHSRFTKVGEPGIFVANSLIDMYVKCGSMMHARWIFDRMPQLDVVSWNTVIFGYAEAGDSEMALQLYMHMKDMGFTPTSLSYVAVLKACGGLGALETGRQIHVQISSAGLQNDALVASCLVGFYGKCGSIFDAEQVFNLMVRRDLVTWNALLAGHAHAGDAKHVFELFEKMQKEHYLADDITFLSILTTCSHTGLVDKGKEYFQSMNLQYFVTPNSEHYACVIDLLGRANHLNDAIVLVTNMPFEPDVTIWKTILGACRKWKNSIIGSIAFESVLKLDDKDSSAYVLMASI